MAYWVSTDIEMLNDNLLAALGAGGGGSTLAQEVTLQTATAELADISSFTNTTQQAVQGSIDAGGTKESVFKSTVPGSGVTLSSVFKDTADQSVFQNTAGDSILADIDTAVQTVNASLNTKGAAITTTCGTAADAASLQIAITALLHGTLANRLIISVTVTGAAGTYVFTVFSK